jgi:hypothetical protein
MIEDFYESSRSAHQNITDQDEALSDSEDDADLAMFDDIFPQDDAETLSPSSNTT